MRTAVPWPVGPPAVADRVSALRPAAGWVSTTNELLRIGGYRALSRGCHPAVPNRGERDRGRADVRRAAGGVRPDN